MKLESRTIVTAVLTPCCAAGLLSLTGCTHVVEWTPFSTAAATDVDHLAPHGSDVSMALASPGYGMAFLTDELSSSGPGRAAAMHGGVDFGPTVGRPSFQHAETVGVYGELSSEPLPGTDRFDGAGNLTQITIATEGASFDPALDPAGRILAFASTQHRTRADIYLKSVNGHTITQLTNDPADDVMPAFAPNSTHIAFASNRSGNWDIFYTNVNGDPAVQLTFDASHELHPTWSPDGKTIAYCKLGEQSGRWEIWTVDVENSSVHHFLEYGLFPQWNPDPSRNKIAFQRARQRGSRLFGVWTIDYVRGEALHPTEIVSAANAAAMHPAWSPDGTRLVFVTVLDPDRTDARPEQADVWAINMDGKGRTNLTNGKFLNLYPVWAADGTVYFLSDRSGVDNIWAVNTSRTIDVHPAASAPLITSVPD